MSDESGSDSISRSGSNSDSESYESGSDSRSRSGSTSDSESYESGSDSRSGSGSSSDSESEEEPEPYPELDSSDLEWDPEPDLKKA